MQVHLLLLQLERQKEQLQRQHTLAAFGSIHQHTLAAFGPAYISIQLHLLFLHLELQRRHHLH
jgi:hypothetical protein